MGCFLSCIRFKKHGRRKSRRIDSKNKDLFEHRNGILSMVSSDECGTLSEQQASPSSQTSGSDLSKELQNEAKFLKSCGALSRCPVELCRASFESQALDENEITNQNKLHLDEQCSGTSDTPMQVHNDHTSYSKHKSICCESMEHEKITRIVHFEEVRRIADVAREAYSLTCFSPQQMESPKQKLRCSNSPYPTPLNLSDEMQTPGTVYTANTDNLRTGKKVKVRAQYIFPVLTPVENIPQDKLNEQDCRSDKSSGLVQNEKIFAIDGRENIPSSDFTYFNSSGETTVKHISRNNYNVVEETPLSKEPDGDRPLLGAMPSTQYQDHISPKGWDGNGIPNTTTKYKEDQKVNWHATPFVVRLEKALSDEKHFPQRKLPHAEPEFDEERKKLI